MQQAIRKGGLPVIDMGYDTKISYVCCVHLLTIRTCAAVSFIKGNYTFWDRMLPSSRTKAAQEAQR